MDHREYIVTQKQQRWYVLVDGSPIGPYVSQDAAEAGAIAMAKVDFRTGRTASVCLEDELHNWPVLYDSRVKT